MRRLLMTFALISTVLFSVPTGATGATKIPPERYLPKGSQPLRDTHGRGPGVRTIHWISST
jgi:hypothetical protein